MEYTEETRAEKGEIGFEMDENEAFINLGPDDVGIGENDEGIGVEKTEPKALEQACKTWMKKVEKFKNVTKKSEVWIKKTEEFKVMVKDRYEPEAPREDQERPMRLLQGLRNEPQELNATNSTQTKEEMCAYEPKKKSWLERLFERKIVIETIVRETLRYLPTQWSCTLISDPGGKHSQKNSQSYSMKLRPDLRLYAIRILYLESLTSVASVTSVTSLSGLSMVNEQVSLLLKDNSFNSLEELADINLLDDKMDSLVDEERDIDISNMVEILFSHSEMFLPAININN
ncbi:20776_t:CDS:2 [Dentiscutata erythropus]|uniref:20776_t:CDS:1 n=1 Tax=Dentiscutata erythropus TaxID=1348616 RepID=A0A9N9A026_9GLOM|nr:20776_t:CDS:2 [Dentiscutata erythropus]